jgi:hypothetical protein
MSDATEARAMRRWQEQLAQMRNDGNWSADELDFLLQNPESRSAGDYIQPGNTIELPQGADLWKYLNSLGVAGGASPDPMTGLQAFMAQKGLTLPQYQQQYGGLPLSFSEDGKTATYDPSFVKNAYSYEPGPDWFESVIPALILGMGAAGLGGFLPGTESVFGGAATAAAGETGIGGWAGAIGEGGTLSGVSDLGWNVAGLAGEGAGAGALEGINWASDIFNPDALSTFTGDASAGWNVAGTSGGTGGAIADGINWASDIFDPNAASGFTGDASAGWNVAQTAGGTGGAVAQQAAKTGLSKFLKDKFNLDVDQNTLGMLGQLGGAGIGLLGSKQQSDALKDLQAQMTGQRAPFLNKAVGYLNNPESFYTSPEATGAANATMRALSTKFGNPGVSPTAQGLATGALYDRYSNTVNSLGSLGLSGQGIQANLGQQIASTSGQPYAIAGNTISGLTSDNSMDEMMKRMFRQQFGLR